MKNLFVLSALVFSFTTVQAEPARLVAADSSNLSALCIAAATSEQSLLELGGAHGINANELNEIRCNGMTVDRFIASIKAQTVTAPRNVVFKKKDESDLTELCYKALSSFDQYQQLLRQRAGKDANLQSELACNGMPVTDFVSRYRQGTDAGVTSLR